MAHGLGERIWTGAKFTITFDLAWKVMKDIIVQHYAVVDFPKGSPSEVLKKAFALQMIDGDVWMDMLKTRNALSDDYDSILIQEAWGQIVTVYTDKFYEFYRWVENMSRELSQPDTL